MIYVLVFIIYSFRASIPHTDGQLRNILPDMESNDLDDQVRNTQPDVEPIDIEYLDQVNYKKIKPLLGKSIYILYSFEHWSKFKFSREPNRQRSLNQRKVGI